MWCVKGGDAKREAYFIVTHSVGCKGGGGAKNAGCKLYRRKIGVAQSISAQSVGCGVHIMRAQNIGAHSMSAK